MGGGKLKKVLMPKEQLIFKIVLKYETDQLTTKSTDWFSKSTATDAKQKIADAKPTVIH